MSEVSMEFVIYRDDDEIVLNIRGDVTPYISARLSGHPDSWEPESGGDSYIEEISINGKAWGGKLTKEENDDAERTLYDKYISNIEDAAEDAAINRYEAMIDYDAWDDSLVVR
ncbi:MAG: hypothetical protein Q8O87_02485 [bacterium]|nr:hypothetical protein [bacterium]